MEPKFWLVFVTALIPLIVGFIYYNNATAGKAWMRESGMTLEKAQSGNMLMIFGFTYILGIFLSFMMSGMVIHQMGIFSTFMGSDFETAGTENYQLYHTVMDKFGAVHRGWGHGLLHGIMAALFVAWPILAINAMFERRGWKYTAIHLGYWVITLALIGGILCAYM